MATLAGGRPDSIVLASEPPFRLGLLTVIPAMRQVEWADQRRTLEPRVMQVLVALADARGEIIGRDALIARCWNGRIVGENSINRVISLLRGLASDTAAFGIETVTKVGYRLTVADAPHAPVPALTELPAKLLGRRQILAGGLGVAVLGVGGLSWALPKVTARRDARALHQAGLVAQRRGGAAAATQALSYFERSVAADPEYAAAWGDLAFTHYQAFGGVDLPEQETLTRKLVEAAQRALRLDPRNREAMLALALHQPIFRRWVEAERQARTALAKLPDEPLLIDRVAQVLAETGQWRRAAEQARKLVKIEPLVPGHQLRLASATWHAGDPAAADRILRRAFRAWPAEMYAGLSRFMFLGFTGRPREALALYGRGMSPLGGTSPLPLEVGLTATQALATGSAADAAEATRLIQEARKTGRIASFIALQYLTAIGSIDTAYALAFDYYLGRRDPVSGERRPYSRFYWARTDTLFASHMRPFRADPRFPQLLATIGLEDYWRATRTRPDYRAI